MADGDRKDPLTSFLFGLKIPDLGLDYNDGTAFFKSIGGLKMETEMTPQQEGGVTAFQRQLAGQRKFTNIVCKKGFTGDRKLWDWRANSPRGDRKLYQLAADLTPVCRPDVERRRPGA